MIALNRQQISRLRIENFIGTSHKIIIGFDLIGKFEMIYESQKRSDNAADARNGHRLKLESSFCRIGEHSTLC
jgi:hypothetical protein